MPYKPDFDRFKSGLLEDLRHEERAEYSRDELLRILERRLNSFSRMIRNYEREKERLRRMKR